MLRCLVSVVMKVHTTGGDFLDKVGFLLLVWFLCVNRSIFRCSGCLFASSSSLRKYQFWCLVFSRAISMCARPFAGFWASHCLCRSSTPFVKLCWKSSLQTLRFILLPKTITCMATVEWCSGLSLASFARSSTCSSFSCRGCRAAIDFSCQVSLPFWTFPSEVLKLFLCSQKIFLHLRGHTEFAQFLPITWHASFLLQSYRGTLLGRFDVVPLLHTLHTFGLLRVHHALPDGRQFSVGCQCHGDHYHKPGAESRGRQSSERIEIEHFPNFTNIGRQFLVPSSFQHQSDRRLRRRWTGGEWQFG